MDHPYAFLCVQYLKEVRFKLLEHDHDPRVVEALDFVDKAIEALSKAQSRTAEAGR